MKDLAKYTLPYEDLSVIAEVLDKVWPNKKIFFITGGTGFFGRWLLEAAHLLEEKKKSGHIFYVLSRRTQEQLELEMPVFKNPIFKIVHSDLENLKTSQLNFKCDYVIHGATDVQKYKESSQSDEACGQETLRLVKHFEQHSLLRFLYISSGAVYGDAASGVAEVQYEAKAPLQLTNKAYTNEKRASEIYVAASKLPYQIVRCFSFVGPYLNPHMAIMEMISSRIGHQNIVVKSPQVVRSYMYPIDFVIQLYRLLFFEGPSDIYNVGSSDKVTLKQLAEIVSAGQCFVSIRDKAEEGSNVVLASNTYYPDTSKIHQLLNINNDIVDLKTAISKTIEFEKNRI